jgi:hypothetical protein
MITFNQKPNFTDAAGGGDNFSKNLIKFLEKKKQRVNFKLSKKTKLIFINNSKSFFFKKDLRYFLNRKRYYFNFEELLSFKKKNPHIPILHRINDTDIARKSNFIDKNIFQINELSDFTIFISSWVKNYFLKKKLRPKNFIVINNVANHSLFNIKNKIFWKKNKIFKIATHHWSNNFQKGFREYLKLDNLLFSNKESRIKFYVIGNLPYKSNWKFAKIIKPLKDKKLSNKLKSFDGYISGAKYEAGGYHVIEALQCGLPVIYFANSGNIQEIVGNRYGLKANKKNILNSLIKLKNKYTFYKKNIVKDFGSVNHNDMYMRYYQIVKKIMI